MVSILNGCNAGLYPPNISTLSSETLVNEKAEQGGGGIPVITGLDQQSVCGQKSYYYYHHLSGRQ